MILVRRAERALGASRARRRTSEPSERSERAERGAGERGAPRGRLGDLEELLADGIDDRLHARVQLQLLEDVADVVLDRVLADEQLLGDVTVVEALGDEAQNLHLAIGEPGGGHLLALVATLDHGRELVEQL